MSLGMVSFLVKYCLLQTNNFLAHYFLKISVKGMQRGFARLFTDKEFIFFLYFCYTVTDISIPPKRT
jgi:hypothetical protein